MATHIIHLLYMLFIPFVLGHYLRGSCAGLHWNGTNRQRRRKKAWRPSLSNAKWMKIRLNFYIEILGSAVTCCEGGWQQNSKQLTIQYHTYHTAYRFRKVKKLSESDRNDVTIALSEYSDIWFEYSEPPLASFVVHPGFLSTRFRWSWSQEFTAQADKTDLILKKASDWHDLCHVAGDNLIFHS